MLVIMFTLILLYVSLLSSFYSSVRTIDVKMFLLFLFLPLFLHFLTFFLILLSVFYFKKRVL